MYKMPLGKIGTFDYLSHRVGTYCNSHYYIIIIIMLYLCYDIFNRSSSSIKYIRAFTLLQVVLRTTLLQQRAGKGYAK